MIAVPVPQILFTGRPTDHKSALDVLAFAMMPAIVKSDDGSSRWVDFAQAKSRMVAAWSLSRGAR